MATLSLERLYHALLDDVTYHKSIAEEGSDHCNCHSCIIDRAHRSLTKYAKKLLEQDKLTIRDPLPMAIDQNHTYHCFTQEWSQNPSAHIINVLGRTMRLMNDPQTKQKTSHCQICGAFHRPNTLAQIKLSDGKFYIVCSRCLGGQGGGQVLVKCNDCDAVEFTRNGVSFRRVMLHGTTIVNLCPSCYTTKYYQCVSCGKTELKGTEKDFAKYPNTRFANYRSPVWICSSCQADVVYCTVCGVTMLPRDVNRRTNSGPPYCRDCYSLANRNIQEFNFKAFRLPRLIGAKEKPSKDMLLFGTEIEIEPWEPGSDTYRNDMAGYVLDFFGRDKCMIKHDGTVGDGIEIVSFPFSWKWLHENKVLWKELFKLISKHNYYAKSGRAGFHVHMSKAAFTSFHLYKFMEFIYREYNRKFIHIMSKRSGNWSFAAFLDSDSGRSLIANAKYKVNMSEERHSAVSLMYAPTVELRIFGGVDMFAEFMENLEFCKSLYELSRDVPLKELKISNFAKYISQNKNKYPHLLKFMVNSRGIQKHYPKTHKSL